MSLTDRPVVLLDIDGVVADFRELYVRCCNRANGTKFQVSDLGDGYHYKDALQLSRKQLTATWDEIKRPGMAARMELLPGAKQGVRELLSIAEVHIVTSPVTSPTWCHDRRLWIEHHFGADLASRITYTAQKHLMQGSVFVDDRITTVMSWLHYNQGLYNWGVIWGEEPGHIDEVIPEGLIEETAEDRRERVRDRYLHDWDALVALVRTAQPI